MVILLILLTGPHWLRPWLGLCVWFLEPGVFLTGIGSSVNDFSFPLLLDFLHLVSLDLEGFSLKMGFHVKLIVVLFVWGVGGNEVGHVGLLQILLKGSRRAVHLLEKLLGHLVVSLTDGIEFCLNIIQVWLVEWRLKMLGQLVPWRLIAQLILFHCFDDVCEVMIFNGMIFCFLMQILLSFIGIIVNYDDWWMVLRILWVWWKSVDILDSDLDWWNICYSG
jgi:hypothetical protein